MFCTNCGAEVSPGQKFCNKCGAPVDPGAVNVETNEADGQATPFDPREALKQSQPQPQVREYQKPKTWPIVLIACLGFAVLIGGATFAAIKITRFISDLSSAGSTDWEYYEDDYSWDGDFDPYLSDEFGDEFDYEYDLDEDYEFADFEFVEVYNYPDYTYLYGKDVIDDDTVIFNGKTIGDFCDFCDKEVLGNEYEIDRDLLYQLMEVHLVDSSFLTSTNTSYFEQSMMYCLLFANEFSDLDVDVYSCSYMLDEPTRYYYDVEVDDEFDQWEVDYSNKEIFFNYGSTEYKSVGEFSMFDDKSMAGWLWAIDDFFGIH